MFRADRICFTFDMQRDSIEKEDYDLIDPHRRPFISRKLAL